MRLSFAKGNLCPWNHPQVPQREGARGPHKEEEEVLVPWAELELKDITAESTRAAAPQRSPPPGLEVLDAPSCIPLGRAPTLEHGTARPGYEHPGNTLLLP